MSTYIGIKAACSALAADIVAGRRSPIADRILMRRPEGEKDTFACRSCRRDLPLSDFASDRTRTRGHDAYCKRCRAEASKAKRRANPRPVGRGKVRRGAERTDADRERDRERKALEAVRIAKMYPAFGTCEVCGNPVAKRPRRQRKSCDRSECVAELWRRARLAVLARRASA